MYDRAVIGLDKNTEIQSKIGFDKNTRNTDKKQIDGRQDTYLPIDSSWLWR